LWFVLPMLLTISIYYHYCLALFVHHEESVFVERM
jgi:hypothetical protein